MDFSIPELLSEEHSLGVFLLVTVAMGGGAACLAGRAIAATWRPRWHVVAYMLVLAVAVRFLHFALFDGKFLSLHYYLVDFGGLPDCRLSGLSADAGAPDGHALRLDQRSAPSVFSWRRRDISAAADKSKSQ